MPKPTNPDCATCGKAAARIERLKNEDDWECSHVDCTQRRVCWSNGTGPAAYRKPESPSNPFDVHFDNPEASDS